MGSLLQTRVGAAVADRYDVERELARGGMAVVFLAHDRKHERRVALKVLDPDVAAAVGADRFHREIRLLARLQHPHVCPLLDSGDAGGALYYVMPYVAGESLRERLARGPLPVADAVRLACEVADALGYAHGRGVVHRDVKPENILLSGDAEERDGRARVAHAVVCDFGIARLTGRDSAVALALSNELHTGTGIAVGTPAYMSPEQAMGERDVDGRADVYALGVVLYEMLTGALPYAEATPREALAARFAGRPASVADRRPGVPPAIDAVVARALAPDPDMRWPTTDAMRDALVAAIATPAPAESRSRERRRRTLGGVAVAVAAVAALVATLVLRAPGPGEPALDPQLYAVVPFVSGGARTLIDGDESEQLMRNAIGRWRDVRLVDALRVSDARHRLGGGQAPTLAGSRDVARALHARYLVWGRIRAAAGRTVVYAGLYDAAETDAEPLRRQELTLSDSADDVGARFAELADSLLVGSGAAPGAARGAYGTRSLEAWRAYSRGHVALTRWELPAALREFRAATVADPDFALAWLWLAQAVAWQPESDGASWRDAAERARSLAAALTPRDSLTAHALVALADQRYDAACAAYRAVLARDPRDFAARFGLGECLRRDDRVVRDAASPSGWRFRTSYHAAASTYVEAFESLPSVHLAYRGLGAERLARLLHTRANHLRIGRAVEGRDTLWFGAAPALRADTLAFVPYPFADIAAVRDGTVPATLGAAIAHNRALLQHVATTWAMAFPTSADAQELLGYARELNGQLAGPDGALAALRAARAAALDSSAARRLAVAEVRVRAKLGDFAAAQRLADSLLAVGGGADDDVLAALVGRATLAARLARRLGATADRFGRGLGPLSPAVLEDAASARTHAAVGAWPESALVYAGRASAALRRTRTRAAADSAQHALLRLTYQLAATYVPLAVIPAGSLGGSFVGDLFAALAAGDTAAVRRGLATLAERRRGSGPGDVSLDARYVEGWLQLAVGDTAAAAAAMDAALAALPTYSTDLTESAITSGALAQLVALRASVAARRGEATVLARWTAALDALWRAADAPLRARLAMLRPSRR